MQIVSILYLLLITGITIFSYLFVDYNFPLQNPLIRQLADVDSTVKTITYVFFIVLAFGLYLYTIYLVRKGKITNRIIWSLIFLNSILLVSYPAFSFDIFNYIATAKVTFLYRENPYIVMPIELSQEPLLSFMHAANKTALYGPSWIVLTSLPFFAGLGNLFLTIFTFKLFNFLFYIGTSYLIFSFSKWDKLKLALFALNPLVVVETLVSGHNDIVMIFFALLAFYLLDKKLYIFSISAITISVLIKFATIFLFPIFIYVFIYSIQNKIINWQRVWIYCFMSMLGAFLVSPLREEMYSWYFIWPFTFLVLIQGYTFIKLVAISLMFGLLLRFAPYIYFHTWEGITPIVKIVVTTVPVILSLLLYPVRKYLK